MADHLKYDAGTGHLTHNAAGHLVYDCACPCDNALIPSSLAISGTFTACEECEDSGEDPWDQTFLNVGSCGYNMTQDGASVDGKAVSNSQAGLGWDLSRCVWSTTILCQSGDDEVLIWGGDGGTDPTDPTGTYTRTGGCDLTATRTVS